jgi:hypothetical protein
MYDHIKEAIANGECLLEWDGGPDHNPPPAPLLKDKFGSERRKAKVRALFKNAGLVCRVWCVGFGEVDSAHRGRS